MQRVKDEDFNSSIPTGRDFIIYPTAEQYLNNYFNFYTYISLQNHCPPYVEFLRILLFQPFVMYFLNTLKY